MKPLIEITTVPIQIEMKTTHAKLEYARGTVEMEVKRDKGGLEIKSSPIRVNIDTFEASNSIVPTAVRSIEQSAAKGRQKAYQATAAYAQQGKLMMETKWGEEVITKFAEDAMNKNIVRDMALDFLPSAAPEFDWDVGEMNIRYEMDKLNFDWKFGEGDFKFTPGDIELTVTQRPEVIIKYIGGPIYVPPSSDPNYEPVDVKG